MEKRIPALRCGMEMQRVRNGNAKKYLGMEMRKQDLEIVIECLADKKAEFFVA